MAFLMRGFFTGLLLMMIGSAVASVPDENVLLVEAGTHTVMREKLAAVRVAVGNPAVADVNIINRRELLVTGKAEGVTSLLVWYQGVRQAKEFRIVVRPVVNPLGEAASLPNLAAHRRSRQQLAADAPDTSSVALSSQVLTEIKIVELSRSTLKQYGLGGLVNKPNTTAAFTTPGAITNVNPGGGGSSSTVVAQNSDGTTTTTTTSTAGDPINIVSSSLLPIQNAFNLVLGNSKRGILGFLSMLEGQGLVRTLAEPSLTATSGQTATFLAGGEFPVPVAQGANAGISIEYKEFGVRLLLTPTVLSADRIALKVAPEVSELDFSAGVTVGGVQVPALTVRRTDTTVELGDGESFVISGLVSRNMLANVDKVPLIGSVPILGAFFRSTRYDRNEKELVMVVTPHLVRPIRAGAALPELPGAKYDGYDPNAAEMIFLESGRFETGLSR